MIKLTDYNNGSPRGIWVNPAQIIHMLASANGSYVHCVGDLGHNVTETPEQIARLIAGKDEPQQWSPGEREDAVYQLRALASRIGDNDWPNELHLGDVIEKHILRHVPTLVEQLEGE